MFFDRHRLCLFAIGGRVAVVIKGQQNQTINDFFNILEQIMSFKDDFQHLKIQLRDIKSATSNFRDKPIGIGGFGEVYKGELSLQEGKKTVAFKRLNRKWGQGDTEFWKEIMMLSQYCVEYDKGELKKILVPEWKKCYEEDKMDDIEMSKDEDVRAKHEERISIANQAATPISYTTRNELVLILSNGILIKGGYREVSINKNGEFQEMLLFNKSKHDDDGYWSVLYIKDNALFALNTDFRLQGSARLYLIGIEFLPVEYYRYGILHLPGTQSRTRAWSEEVEIVAPQPSVDESKWFSVSKHMKKRHMLPAVEVLKEGSASTFQLVAEFCEIESFTISCKIDPELLSTGINYACYLVYKVPEKHSMVSGLVQIDHETLKENDGSSYSLSLERNELLVDLRTPTDIPFIGCNPNDQSGRTRRIKGHPKLRKDGWTEVQILDFKYDRSKVHAPTIQMHCHVRSYHKWKFSGLLVQGIEFRPVKVYFNNPRALSPHE
ncbi:hypothetical protein L1987_55825 [Smallanthus sonchifolius]|uniref:Uncharacterized protein n=1 Tax=Smallanthus sonchifolius TaxID=185202 RepID=A0ACB9EBR7_9ASTR|nr:hypothetical protein L1987_55825 [Smallanthus sonchifolius]